MCASQYPAHPAFGTAIKPAALRSVREQVSRAVQEPEWRVAIDKPLRPSMMHIAVPLRLGEMGETHFVLGRHWFSHFEKLSKPLTVAKLREAIDEPLRMGLPITVENLVILTYADQANLAFRRHGGPCSAKLDDLPDDLELREEELPAQDVWNEAIDRAGKVFGITVSPLLNASNASELAAKLGEAAAADMSACSELVERLGVHRRRFLDRRGQSPAAKDGSRHQRPCPVAEYPQRQGAGREARGDGARHLPPGDGDEPSQGRLSA